MLKNRGLFVIKLVNYASCVGFPRKTSLFSSFAIMSGSTFLRDFLLAEVIIKVGGFVAVQQDLVA